MQTEILDFGVLDERQVSNFNVGRHTVAFEHLRHDFRVIGQLTPSGDFILTLLLTLMAQYPGGDEERHHADHGGDDGGQQKRRPDLLGTPDKVFILQYLQRVVLKLFLVITHGIDRLGFKYIAHRRQRLAPVIQHAINKRLPGQFHPEGQRDNDGKQNNEAINNNIGNLAEHTDAHARNLTTLGHILGIKTHDIHPV